MDQDAATTGDRLQEAIEGAVAALLKGNTKAVWEALDGAETSAAMRRWDRLRGRPVVSEEELQSSRQALVQALRR